MEADPVPILAMSVEAQTILSTLLNPLKLIPTDNNLPRDWRGLAELTSVPSEKTVLFESKADPFKELLTYLANPSVQQHLGFDDFKALLGVIDRFDALDDVEPILERDKLAYKARLSNIQLDRSAQSLDSYQDRSIFTFEDAKRSQNGLSLCLYDAFILYSEEDSSFASEVINRMENDYQLKLCSKDRDLLPGLRFEHEVIGKMIEARCNRLLVIFSPSFLESTANQFLVSYGQAVALDNRCRKIIPCIYKRCELPPSVRYSFCIDYNRSGKLWNFWDKLSQSLVTATATTAISAASLIPAPNRTLEDTDDSRWDTSNSTKLSTSDSGISSHCHSNVQQEVDTSDTLSIHSRAQLLPTNKSSSKPSKWLSKFIKPSKKGKQVPKKENQTPIAE